MKAWAMVPGTSMGWRGRYGENFGLIPTLDGLPRLLTCSTLVPGHRYPSFLAQCLATGSYAGHRLPRLEDVKPMGRQFTPPARPQLWAVPATREMTGLIPRAREVGFEEWRVDIGVLGLHADPGNIPLDLVDEPRGQRQAGGPAPSLERRPTASSRI